MPKFSIILPVHNAADYIRRTLESILNQSFTDYELIVICDSCTDNTQEIVESYGIAPLVVEYGHSAPTRNAGMDAASGEWLLFTDDDDWWLHEYAFEELAAQCTDDCDIVAYSFIWKGVGYTRPVRPGGIYWPAPWTKAYRRSMVGDIRFPWAYPDDLLFTNKILSERFARIKAFDSPLYYYNYMRPGSITDKMHAAGVEPDLRRKHGT